jgi:methionyl-tRNA formyltransferase
MKALILTEAGSEYGYGHLSRCSALKQGLEHFGMEVAMFVRGDISNRDNFEKYEWLEKFDETVLTGIDIVVVDSYHAPVELYERVAKNIRLCVWFDDTNRIEYPKGKIIDSNTPLLRKSFWDPLTNIPKTDKLFLSLGSANSEIAKYEIELSKKYRVVTAVGLDENTLTGVMSSCFAAVSACGQTMLELAALGIPTVGIITAENQRQNANYCLENNHILGIASAPEEALLLIDKGIKLTPLKSSTLDICSEIYNQVNNATGLKIAILTSPNQWFVSYASVLASEIGANIFYEHESVDECYDVVFILSYHRIVSKVFLTKHKHNVVVHASDLPRGKGWAPMFWQVLEGKNTIPIVMLEADEGVDSGDIYLEDSIKLDGFELNNQLRQKLADKTTELCRRFIDNYPLVPTKQLGAESFYKKRRPEDSRLDVNKSIKEQFLLLRIVDNDEYPAFFEIDGHRYNIKIERCKE